ncbi:MAG: IS200/IS605 family transposase [Bacteroidetes bacterium]|nr:IS200/IS605 family transposase [Bacteroidota bacterium]
MANTYTQLYFHVILTVKFRASLISPKWKVELYKFICGITNNKKQKIIAINGMPDHLHILIGQKPDICLSDIVRDIKANSSRFINQRNLTKRRFEWQVGFGAFTFGYSQMDTLVRYVQDQEKHHGKTIFLEEYLQLLVEHNIDFHSDYLFKEPE